PAASVLVGLDIVLAVAAAAGLIALIKISRPGPALLVLTAFLTSVPVLSIFYQGQLSLLLFFGWLGFIAFEGAGKHKAAGLCLALLLIKPQIAVLAVLFLALKGRWAALKTFLAAAAALGAVSLLVA